MGEGLQDWGGIVIGWGPGGTEELRSRGNISPLFPSKELISYCSYLYFINNFKDIVNVKSI